MVRNTLRGHRTATLASASASNRENGILTNQANMNTTLHSISIQRALATGVGLLCAQLFKRGPSHSATA